MSSTPHEQGSSETQCEEAEGVGIGDSNDLLKIDDEVPTRYTNTQLAKKIVGVRGRGIGR